MSVCGKSICKYLQTVRVDAGVLYEGLKAGVNLEKSLSE